MMSDPDPQHIVDQALATYRDLLDKSPRILYLFYDDLKKNGFNDAQALELTKASLISILGGRN